MGDEVCLHGVSVTLCSCTIFSGVGALLCPRQIPWQTGNGICWLIDFCPIYFNFSVNSSIGGVLLLGGLFLLPIG